MATITLTDLPLNRALDHRAMRATTGAAGAPWVFGAFRAFVPASAQILPIVNFYQTNYIADNLTLQLQNINVQNSAPGATISVGADQNAATLNLVAVAPHA
jgi:hypothetical protein